MRRNALPLLLALALMATGPGISRAGDDDHLVARRALEEGRVLPLTEVLAKVKAKVPGKVIEVELELEDGVLVYEFKIVTPSGRLMEVEADAATGAILKAEDDD